MTDWISIAITGAFTGLGTGIGATIGTHLANRHVLRKKEKN